MPSFYPHSMSRQLHFTPPEFSLIDNSRSCGCVQCQSGWSSAAPAIAAQENCCMEDRYCQPPIAASVTMPYPLHMDYSIPPMQLNKVCDDMNAPSLHPMQSHGSTARDKEMSQKCQPDQNVHVEVQAKDEKSVGGVSAKLDYDMEWMTDFVSDMAHGMYALLKSPICIADIDLLRSVQPGRPMPTSFRKWVHQVLCATRLPSATILLSLHYLSVRMTMLSTGVPFKSSDVQIYRLLTIAFVLGSKFLDDNTFINKSWSEVSGISVADLNRLEIEWLMTIEFKLHRDPSEQQGFCSWLAHWKDFEAQASARAKSNILAPKDNSIQRTMQKSFSSELQLTQPKQQDLSAKPAQSQYNMLGYKIYDPWLIRRSTRDNSPASAPHTGPTTPEYYGGPGTWAPPDYYSNRTLYGFSQIVNPPEPCVNVVG